MISAIIPAYNEERTIARLVSTLKTSGLFSEIFIVNDCSTDHTAFLARRAGAIVISLPKNIGKGGALSVGVRASKEPILLFLDADISGITKNHLQNLINPILNNEADMTVGLIPKWRWVNELNDSIPLLSGQRAMKREIFEQVPEELRRGYQIEEALNYYCQTNDQRVKTINLDGIEHLQKIPKSNFLFGLHGYFKMVWQVAKIFVVVRLVRVFKFLIGTG
ncbi:MAG: glycosyltransferase family 2 protein [Candidatus Magasanikbacteria bacterium]|nr:glycosyltransferase family 2 protein [Candidatus Magasanikbacteria bacterium]